MTQIGYSIALCLSSVVVTLADGQSGATNLTGTAGTSLALKTGLQQYDHVTLYTDSSHRVLLNFYRGALLSNESERFQLDTKTGSVIISPLNVSDGGVYVLQIFYEDNSFDNYTFEVTVTRPDPSPTPTQSSDDATSNHKNNLVVGLSVGFTAAAAGLMIYCVVRCHKNGGRCRSFAARGNSGANSVV